jgi:light-regulated signal transduction histidine kinase (bacteriophytochrome)
VPGGTEFERGKELFDTQRRDSMRLQARLESARRATRGELSDAAGRVSLIFGLFGAVLLASLLAATWTMRRTVIVPLRALAARVRRVAGGDFEQTVDAEGAREVRQVAGDVDDMRRQILAERDELARSNAELEQFAYVASHDLQEPLRKIASFSQMLQRRYGGQLDERADTYIEFAVDGAKRMQELINDLLAFSRVGRMTEAQEEIEADVLATHAVAALASAIDETGAQVEIGDLPTVRGEPALLALVFQNLIANGIKFRGDEPPHIRLSARRDGDHWQFTLADNGIGIEPEYADRIFIIFQRLHTRATYEGTGIGLAMCRKVIEYHGGRIWLDEQVRTGATFHFTLPVIKEDPQ